MVFLNAGDVFASKNPNGLGFLITTVEARKALDGKAEYGHTGIIQTQTGKTLEAVWSIAEQNIYDAYKGQKVLIARYIGMTPEAYKGGIGAVLPLLGRSYPFHRLFLHLLGFGKSHITHTPVCSELTAEFLINAGARMLSDDNFWGVTPDNLVDEWRISKHFDIIFEGIM